MGLLETARKTAERHDCNGAKRAPLKIADPQPALYRQTDIGNAERLRDRHGENLRYCHLWNKWLVWDGRRWKIDDSGAVTSYCKETVRSMYAELSGIASDEMRRAAAAHITKSESAARIGAMEMLARSELPITPDRLDTDPWLLNVANGTIDLQTGQLREHRREDFITKISPTPFDADAPSLAFDGFIEAIFDGNQALVDFARRLFGYALTGDTREQVLPIFYGKGSNGKSTLLAAILETLGEDYAIRIAKEAIVVRKQAGHPTERMDLHGKRLAVCSETDDGARLAEGLVKDLTGCDRIRGRRVCENSWEFSPTHKIILPTNHRPEVRGTDHAIWRRLALVPFAVQYWDADKGESGPEALQADKMLPGKLKAEAPGILAWMVRGCREWLRDGLRQPDVVRAATNDYRVSQDIVTAFLSECCLMQDGIRVRAGELYTRYKKWIQDGGEEPVTQKLFGEAMGEKGFTRQQSNGVWYLGVAIRAE